MKNICIIGGGGFIGKNLTIFYSQKGYAVKVIGRSASDFYFNQKNIEFLQLDIANTDQLIKALSSCEFVIWLASALVPSTKNESLVNDFELNTAPLIHFFEKANRMPFLKKFIYLSSGGTIYGDTNDHKPLDENTSKHPISSYGLSKIVTENYIKFLTQNLPIQSFILRPSNVYGKYQNLLKPQGIIGFAFQSILNNTSIDLYNEGKVTRDFIYVTDLVKAIDCCFESDFKISETSVYNVGSQQGYTIKEVLDKISGIATKNLNIIVKPSRDFDCSYNVLKIDKINKELNWNPETDFDEGLQIVWNWIKNEK
jgi:UDP-glucose 4-epimerase